MENIMPTVAQCVTTILCALLSLAAAVAVRAINSWAVKLQCDAVAISDQAARSMVEAAIARIHRLATDTVLAIEQTSAATLREAIKQGVSGANREDLLALGRDACDRVLASLSGDYREALKDACINVEDYVKSVVEAKVYELKNSPPLFLEAGA